MIQNNIKHKKQAYFFVSQVVSDRLGFPGGKGREEMPTNKFEYFARQK